MGYVFNKKVLLIATDMAFFFHGETGKILIGRTLPKFIVSLFILLQ